MNSERFPNQKKEFEGLTGLSFALYLPNQTLTNEQIEGWGILTPNGNKLTAESIFKKTGVKRRYVAKSYEDSFYMADNAFKNTFKGGNIDAIFATSSYPTGINTAKSLKEIYGLSAEVTLDIFAACSGFSRVFSLIKENEEFYTGKKVAIVSSEVYSDKVFDLKTGGIQKDPSLAQTIFSDGAAAFSFTYGKDLTVLSSEEKKLPKELNWSICMPIDSSLMRMPFIEEYIPRSTSGKFEQDGKTVYKAVVNNVPDLIEEAVDKAGLKAQDIKLIIPHQGSGHIIKGIEERLPDYRGKIVLDIEDGNFSSASIPKAFMKGVRNKDVGKGDNIIFAGFGAGLFASVAVVRL